MSTRRAVRPDSQVYRLTRRLNGRRKRPSDQYRRVCLPRARRRWHDHILVGVTSTLIPCPQQPHRPRLHLQKDKQLEIDWADEVGNACIRSRCCDRFARVPNARSCAMARIRIS